MVTLLSIAAGVVVVVLLWNLYRRFGSDRLSEITERRRGTSRMVSRGEFVDGSRHLAVALAMDQSTFFYENADMQASIDLQFVREIEYDTELATGTAIESGKVLRMRSGSQMFEFVLPHDVVPRWHQMLPPRPVMEVGIGAPEVAPRTANAT